jgi:hypothetical protein
LDRVDETRSVTFASLTIPGAWIVGPRSYLVDRILADVEQIWLGEVATGGGAWTIERGTFRFVAPAPPDRLRRFAKRVKPEPPVQADGPFLDLRDGNPGNWAHFLNNHMALVALIGRETDLDWRDLTMLLPARPSGWQEKLVGLLGLKCIFTDQTVEGAGVRVQIPDWNSIRGERGALLRDPAISPVAAALADGRIAPQDGAPRKLFVARRGTRALVNQPEIEALLHPQGFATVYPEDLSVDQEIRYFIDAEEIVAIHGAGLAPLIYRTPGAPASTLLEILPVGHITNFYRAMIADLNGRWVGARGHIEADQVAEIYNLDQPYLKHSLRDFRIDPRSVEVALDLLRQPQTDNLT